MHVGTAEDVTASLAADAVLHHVAALHDQGLDDLAVPDAVHGTAFFHWADRLMLCLGVPETREV